jgi:hypothetical protein
MLKTNIPAKRPVADPRSRMEARIQSVEEAKTFLKELHDNGEDYHPEDDATDNVNEDIAENGEELNECMEDIYNLPNVPESFDPCGYLLDLDKSFGVFSSNGFLTVNSATGEVMDCVLDDEKERGLTDIARFDVDEWRKAYPNETLGSTLEGERGDRIVTTMDILDIGYWVKDGTYEGPVTEWREEFRKSLTGE